jgi:hypothetical protein
VDRWCLVTDGAARTRFSSTVISPLASITAVSPRICETLPVILTVWPVKASRYCELMRGHCSAMASDTGEAMSEGGGLEEER